MRQTSTLMYTSPSLIINSEIDKTAILHTYRDLVFLTVSMTKYLKVIRQSKHKYSSKEKKSVVMAFFAENEVTLPL